MTKVVLRGEGQEEVRVVYERTSEDEKSTAKGKYFLKGMNVTGLVVANVKCPNRLGGPVIDLICVGKCGRLESSRCGRRMRGY